MWKVYDNDDEDDYDDKNDDNGQRTNFGSEKVTWALGSDELKKQELYSRPLRSYFVI